MSLRRSRDQSSWSSSSPAVVGFCAKATALRAPAEEPATRSGRIPASNSAREHPDLAGGQAAAAPAERTPPLALVPDGFGCASRLPVGAVDNIEGARCAGLNRFHRLHGETQCGVVRESV